MAEGVDEGEDVNVSFCDLIEKDIPLSHEFFRYQTCINLAQANIGIAISTGSKLQETREILDMLDTISSGIYDSDVRLPDDQRKKIRRSEDTWIDMKEKMSKADLRSAYLLGASSYMQDAVGHLVAARADKDFSGLISDYTIKYLHKLSQYTYREAMGHVLM
ncbi:MAG: hypothetical protein B2I17_00200 [Thermoplasmatales archaeon B_DKE]|nr:MAG: hypothetical protein B2I17_00200 [Thermoplasmatales archaeon B_DKE]QRF74657.1 hypothetical protein Thermo_00145 [Thermoplasmatales archaeon]